MSLTGTAYFSTRQLLHVLMFCFNIYCIGLSTRYHPTNSSQYCFNHFCLSIQQMLESIKALFHMFYNRQRQLSRGVLKKRYSEDMQQIYRRTTMLKCDCNKFALPLYWNNTLAWVLSYKFAAYCRVWQKKWSVSRVSALERWLIFVRKGT